MDGSVYIEAEGEKKNLDEFVKECKKGSTYAVIDEFQINEGEVKGLNKFLVK